MNFLRRLALQDKKLNDRSLLDVVEIALVPDTLPSLFPSWAKDLSASRCKAKVVVCSEMRTKQSTQSELHVEFLNVQPGGT